MISSDKINELQTQIRGKEEEERECRRKVDFYDSQAREAVRVHGHCSAQHNKAVEMSNYYCGQIDVVCRQRYDLERQLAQMSK